MPLIDNHAHLYEDVFHQDIDNVVSKIKNTNVEKVILQNTEINSIKNAIELEKKYPDLFRSMLGIHPDNLDEDHYKTQIDIILKAFDEWHYVGIGEVGLDYYESKISKNVQQDFLHVMLSFAKSKNLPLSLHIRNAYEDAIKILMQHQDGNLKACVHCFSGSLDEAKQYIDLNLFLGIGGIITFKNNKLKDIIQFLPLDKILTETDAPCLAPEPVRGTRNDSSNLVYIVNKIADILDTPYHEIIKSINQMVYN